LRRTGDDKPSLAIRHSYLGYNRYQRAVDEGDYLAFLGMDDAERQPVLALISNAWNARVAMYHPQPTILVFVGETGGPEFFARCP
jgi:hypothetical protein